MNITVVTAWTNSSQANINSRFSGEELLQQWLTRHPEIVKRAATELVPEKKRVEQKLFKANRCDLMKEGYTSITGMKYPPEVAKELANITDLPPSLHCIS